MWADLWWHHDHDTSSNPGISTPDLVDNPAVARLCAGAWLGALASSQRGWEHFKFLEKTQWSSSVSLRRHFETCSRQLNSLAVLPCLLMAVDLLSSWSWFDSSHHDKNRNVWVWWYGSVVYNIGCSSRGPEFKPQHSIRWLTSACNPAGAWGGDSTPSSGIHPYIYTAYTHKTHTDV